ncbi:MAG: anaerobic ribonucleoside-triphosphate reductase activating protein [Roseburia sp.]|nr:anaerobic ribonucleoside-triphosphate reductase activating protein [Roseburia sp.]
MNYADIKQYDVANGLGVRVSIFVSGCTHYCKNCFNEETWDFNYGKPFTEAEIDKIISYLKPDHVAGLSVLGGEPFEPVNQEGLLPLLRAVKQTYPDKDIWCYSGYLFDQQILGQMCKESEVTKEMLSYIDILVDGRFVEEKKSLKLRFRGSENQRIIDVKKSLAAGEVIHWEHENDM